MSVVSFKYENYYKNERRAVSVNFYKRNERRATAVNDS